MAELMAQQGGQGSAQPAPLPPAPQLDPQTVQTLVQMGIVDPQKLSMLMQGG
jgi:hypothetical protein